jgi:hypothetical protein
MIRFAGIVIIRVNAMAKHFNGGVKAHDQRACLFKHRIKAIPI